MKLKIFKNMLRVLAFVSLAVLCVTKETVVAVVLLTVASMLLGVMIGEKGKQEA